MDGSKGRHRVFRGVLLILAVASAGAPRPAAGVGQTALSLCTAGKATGRVYAVPDGPDLVLALGPAPPAADCATVLLPVSPIPAAAA